MNPARMEEFERRYPELGGYYHKEFDEPDAEERFFGASASVIEIRGFVLHPVCGEPEMRKGKGLKPEQERELFLRYDYAKRAYSIERGRTIKNSGKANGELEMWLERVMKTRKDLVSANLALVLAMAKRARIPDVEFSELVSEGNFALLRAVNKFDVSRGFKFSTYACRAILKAYNRIYRKTENHKKRFPCQFDPKLEKSDESSRRNEEDYRDVKCRLDDCLENGVLNNIEAVIIQERFGLGDGRAKTLIEVGKIVGLTNERVRQIQRDALSKLRIAMGASPELNREKRKRARRISLEEEVDTISGEVTARQYIYAAILNGSPIEQVQKEIEGYWGKRLSEEHIGKIYDEADREADKFLAGESAR